MTVALLSLVLFAAIDIPLARHASNDQPPSSRGQAAAAPNAAAPPAPAAAPAPSAASAQGAPAVSQAKPAEAVRFAQATVLANERPAVDIARRNLHPPITDRATYLEWMKTHTNQPDTFLSARWDCGQEIVALGQIHSTRVLEGFLLTPREEFCRTPQRAYENAAMPIGYGQTISGPYLVARMTDALNPQPNQSVLEVGTGSGYQSALLSELSSHVFSVEIVEALARETDRIYRSLWDRFPEYRNVKRKIDDGYFGWQQYAPFDRIIVTCGIDHIPPELLRELAPEGIMVIPVGPPSGQTILRIIKHVLPDGSVRLEREDIYHGGTIIFVPFTSRSGLHTK
ncbi:MAG: protein-L-isoaspartate O-methyltransferase family protein [Spirochaetia bacterium]